ncbi:MAG: hypothetical protein AMS27_05435 [Bacteroides sp. SM23_62_1]|nr:MAG: hypothetical protein AMS27_05435 [Bacteroides sp. SM23_62_1]
MKDFRIAVIGAGAVGGITAAILRKSGLDVSLVTKHPQLAMKISHEGIHAFGHCGDIWINVPAVPAISDLEGYFDLAMIATKGYDMSEAAEKVLPYLRDDSRVISMQNGICEDDLANVVGKERTVGCVVGWGATMRHPGEVEMTSGGEFVIGNWKREKDIWLEDICGILNYIVPTRISDNIESSLYSKLIINSCITTLGVISGLYLGEILAIKKARDILIHIISEAIKVANAMGIEVEPFAGKLDYYSFLKKGLLSNFKQHLTIRVIGYKYRKLKSSSLQSIERGKRTEVNNYNGYIAIKGKENGIKTPVNEQLTRMVKEIEEGKRKITPENFKALTG